MGLTDANAIYVRLCNLQIDVMTHEAKIKSISSLPYLEMMAALNDIIDAQWPDADDPVARDLVNRARTRIGLLTFHFPC